MASGTSSVGETVEFLNASWLSMFTSSIGVGKPVPGNLSGNSWLSAIMIGAEILPRMEDPVFERAGPSLILFPDARNLLMLLGLSVTDVLRAE